MFDWNCSSAFDGRIRSAVFKGILGRSVVLSVGNLCGSKKNCIFKVFYREKRGWAYGAFGSDAGSSSVFYLWGENIVFGGI